MGPKERIISSMQKRRKFQLGRIVVVLLLAVGGGITLSAINRNVDFAGMIGEGRRAEIQLPPGFHATIFAEGLDGPRFLAFDSAGILHVADRGNNRIVALPDANEDGVADGIRVFANEVPRGVHAKVVRKREEPPGMIVRVYKQIITWGLKWSLAQIT